MQCSDCDSAVAEEIKAREIREGAEAAESRLRASGLPIDYRTGRRKLTDLPARCDDAILACQMLGERIKGLFLYGEAGSFKTSVAASRLAQHIAAGGTGLYVFVPDLMTDIHASYRREDGESRDTLVSRCVNTPRLVLDDLGKEKASEHGAGVIFEILDGRYRTWRPGRWTIVTSNFDLDALCDRFPGEEFSDPIRRRLAELTISVPMDAR